LYIVYNVNVEKKGGIALNKKLKAVLMITLVVGFSILLLGGFWIYQGGAPYPSKVVDQKGEELLTQKQIKGGQAVYQKYGLMDYGSVLGHGSYLGPDYTAQALHITVGAMRDFYAQQEFQKNYSEITGEQQAGIADKVKKEIHENRYDEKADTLTLTEAQAAGLQAVEKYYHDEFINGDVLALPTGMIQESHMPDTNRAYVNAGDQVKQMADFFFWTAWISSTNRPGLDHTYTNNWPYDPEAGNVGSFSAVWWSAASVALLILITGLILYLYNRYNFKMEDAYEEGKQPILELSRIQLTQSQRKVGKFFFIVALLFLIQSLLGGFLAHYYVEGDAFFGISLKNLLPFNIAKGWHLQLAIFWIATAWLAMGIYIAPLVSGKEEKKQGLLVDILFWALVVVVGGSMLGEWLGVKGYLGNQWFLLGDQGWEYLELGRVWQVLLTAGLFIWLFIIYRGLRKGLAKETDKGGLVHLLFYSSIAIPAFYVFAFFINPSTHITYADYWRWWIIHLWVEGIFEVFAVIVIGFLMVQMGLVTKRSTIRSLYFQVIVLLAGGIVGTGHHYYWIGSNEAWIGLGAVFSAIEVIPLTLLVAEAYGQYKMMKDGGANFPYRASFWFLIATAIWNLFGAGVLGFLINLPVVNYFEHGSYLTPTHGHGSMMGVYGMFSIAILLYTMRNIVKPEAWSDRLAKLSLWGLNIGLAGMILMSLLPVGFLQLKESYTKGFWAARDFSFYEQSLVKTLLWIRMLPDSIFILGIIPLVLLVWKGFRNLRQVSKSND